jgi:hypothetical protein
MSSSTAPGDLWTEAELAASVEAYRRMQWLSSAGATFIKAAFFRAYQDGPLAGRSKRAFDERMMNISFLLEEKQRRKDEQSLANHGYSPHSHVGSHVTPILEDQLHQSAEKDYVAFQICYRLGIGTEIVQEMDREGGTIEKDLYLAVCDRLDLDPSGGKHDLARRIMSDAGIAPDTTCFSSGDTVTAHGLRFVHAALDSLLPLQTMREQERRPPGEPASTSAEPLVTSTALERRHNDTYSRTQSKAKTKATRRESRLVHDYCDFLGANGHSATRKKIGTPGTSPMYNDIWVEDRRHLIEAKGETTRGNVRMAIGQLIDYGRFVEDVRATAVLLPKEPSDDLKKFVKAAKSSCIWASDMGFEDDAGGAFC